MFFPNISASDAKFENSLNDSETILLRGSQLKNELIWPRRLGCRGGAIDLAAAHLVIRALLYLSISEAVSPARRQRVLSKCEK